MPSLSMDDMECRQPKHTKSTLDKDITRLKRENKRLVRKITRNNKQLAEFVLFKSEHTTRPIRSRRRERVHTPIEMPIEPELTEWHYNQRVEPAVDASSQHPILDTPSNRCEDEDAPSLCDFTAEDSTENTEPSAERMRERTAAQVTSLYNELIARR